MNSLPIHPMIVHVPMALAVLVPLLALTVLFAWLRGAWPSRTWLLVVLAQAVLVAGAWAAIETGEREEERVERVISERLIEGHEERAEVFLGAGAAVLGVALLAAVVPGPSPKRWIAALAVAGTLAVAFLGYRVGSAGGELVYRHGAAAAYVDSPSAGPDARRAATAVARSPRERERDDD